MSAERALPVVDVRNGFVNPVIDPVPGRIRRLIERGEHDPVLFTRLVNTAAGPSRRFLDWHGWAEPPKTDLAPDVVLLAAPDRIFDTPGSTGIPDRLADRLKAVAPERVAVVGIATDVCILKGGVAMDVFDLGIRPVVFFDGRASTAGLPRPTWPGSPCWPAPSAPTGSATPVWRTGRLGAPPADAPSSSSVVQRRAGDVRGVVGGNRRPRSAVWKASAAAVSRRRCRVMPRRSAVAAVCLLAAMSVAAAGGGPAAARQFSVSPLGGAAAGAAPDGAAPCAVTQSNGRRPPNPERVFGGTAPGGYGNDALWTSLRMWGEEGTVVVPATHRQADGALGPMKWSWYQDGPGVLRIDGRRLDAPAAPLRTDSPGGYGGQGFHPVGLIFPTGGCWEITGWVGEASLSFVTLVIPPDPVPAPLPPPPVLSDNPVPCLVTQPNGDVPPDAGNPDFIGGYGNDALWTNLWMWSDEGTVPVPASHVLPDGAFGPMKWAWYRSAPGRLAIEGHRLDAPAPPLRASIPDGYGARGFQVSGLVFPTAGCWEVTGTVGDASLTFVTLVVAPASRPD